MNLCRISLLTLTAATLAGAQSLSVKWEELTAGDFVSAIQKAQGTCLLPFGILEKHGPHLPKMFHRLPSLRNTFSTFHSCKMFL